MNGIVYAPGGRVRNRRFSADKAYGLVLENRFVMKAYRFEEKAEMELGSEFYLDLSRLEETTDTVFTYLGVFYTIYTDSGRSALRLLADRLSRETVLIPDYICGTVMEAMPESSKIICYPVDRRFGIDLCRMEELIRGHSIRFLYLMHYFGTLQRKDILSRIAEWKEKYQLTVIEDTTHSIFTERLTVGDYGIASLRKWFPIPDGGVLYTKEKKLLPRQPEEKRKASRKVEAMLLKKLFLTEGFDCNTKYREIFAKEEAAFDCQTVVYGMSDIARFLLSHFSIDSMCERRRKNTALLLEGLRHMGYEAAVEASETDVLLTLPVYVKERDCLRRRLMEHHIYCAVHWPLEHSGVYEDAGWIRDHILSLPIDQRYQRDEMEYLLECLEICRE